MDDTNPVIAKTSMGQGSVDFGLIANEIKSGDLFIGQQRAFSAFDDDAAAVVPAHNIYSQAHRKGSSGNPPTRAGRFKLLR